MIKLLIIFLVLIGGFLVGPLLSGHQGIAFFQLAGYRIKMSMTTFIILELLLFLFIYIIYWILKQCFYSKTVFGRWLRSKSPQKAIKRIEQAQILLLEGDNIKAAKLLAKSAKSSTNTTLTYLQAAQVNINDGKLIEARNLLDEAAKTCHEKEQFAFKLILLRLQIKNGEYDYAKKTVKKLLEQKPRHPEVLRLADQLYYQMGDFQSIIDILPAMYKSAAFNESQLDQFKHIAYLGRIKQLAENEGLPGLMAWWNAQPQTVRENKIYQKTIIAYQEKRFPSD